MRLRSSAEILGLPKRSVLLSCGRFDTCRRSTLSCWRRIRISATSFVLGLKSEAMMWRISRSNSIIKWQGYRVSASRLAESNFRYTQVPREGAQRCAENRSRRATCRRLPRETNMRAQIDKRRFGPWAVITGASSGIGKEFARQIAASGINIVLVARREDLLKEAGVEFSKRYGVEHRVVVLDVSREDFIGQLVSATDDLDIGLVVSNAGTGNPGEFLKLDRQLLQ